MIDLLRITRRCRGHPARAHRSGPRPATRRPPPIPFLARIGATQHDRAGCESAIPVGATNVKCPAMLPSITVPSGKCAHLHHGRSAAGNGETETLGHRLGASNHVRPRWGESARIKGGGGRRGRKSRSAGGLSGRHHVPRRYTPPKPQSWQGSSPTSTPHTGPATRQTRAPAPRAPRRAGSRLRWPEAARPP